MVAVLSEWWLVPTTADHCGHIPADSEVQREVECTHCVHTSHS